MKIIAKTPVDPARIAQLLGGQAAPSLAAYKQFLAKYGGGHVFPNSVRLNEPIPLEGPLRVFSVQFFYTPDKVDERSAIDIIKRDFAAPFIAIAVIQGGDTLVLSLDPNDMGAIWFWSSYGDGVHGTSRRVADSFADLLGMFAYFEDEGMTPPWDDMGSVDDAPAVDLVLDP